MPRPVPPPASEPPLPRDVKCNDELYLIGVHLAQYRHATRSPTDYWEEALRRDFGDSRATTRWGYGGSVSVNLTPRIPTSSERSND